MMTKAQEKAYNNLKNEFLGFYGHPETKEFKKDEVTENWAETDMIYVVLEVGMIGDEGTMASILCRMYLSVAIGRNGGYYTFRANGKRVSRNSVTSTITKGRSK